MKKTLFIIIGSTLIACSGNAETSGKNDLSSHDETKTHVTVVPQVGYVDLTYAAEQSVNAVVYIKVTKMGKTHKVTYRDPFASVTVELLHNSANTRNPTKEELVLVSLFPTMDISSPTTMLWLEQTRFL